jgi:hypothetical protein
MHSLSAHLVTVYRRERLSFQVQYTEDYLPRGKLRDFFSNVTLETSNYFVTELPFEYASVYMGMDAVYFLTIAKNQHHVFRGLWQTRDFTLFKKITHKMRFHNFI